MGRSLLPAAVFFALVCGAALADDLERADDRSFMNPEESPVAPLCPGRSAEKASPQVLSSAVCTADCWDGSWVTCSGSQCSAIDSNCPSQRGFCWSDAEGTKRCPECCHGAFCKDSSWCCPGCFCDTQIRECVCF